MGMIIGVLSIRLIIRSSRSLKEKRRVIKSLKDRVRNRFNVSIAEIGMQDNRQCAVIGIAMTGCDRRFVNETLSSIINFFSLFTQIELIDYDMEFL